MNILHSIKNVIIIFLAFGVTIVLLGFVKSQNKEKNTEDIVQEVEVPVPAEQEQMNFFEVKSLKGVTLYLENPIENQSVTSPITIKGKAPGNWFFEASAPVTITNWDGLIIGEHYITAQGEWMTTDYVPFEGTLEFTNTEYGDYGFLILQKHNASDEPEFDDAVEFKVLFK